MNSVVFIFSEMQGCQTRIRPGMEDYLMDGYTFALPNILVPMESLQTTCREVLDEMTVIAIYRARESVVYVNVYGLHGRLKVINSGSWFLFKNVEPPTQGV